MCLRGRPGMEREEVERFQEEGGQGMKEMGQEEFEDEIARMCDDHEKVSGPNSRLKCGMGFCKARPGDECESVPRVREWLKAAGTTAVVMFRNNDFCSSSFGAFSCIAVGPGKTYRAVEDCEGRWLNDAPSQRQYADCFVRGEGIVSRWHSLL